MEEYKALRSENSRMKVVIYRVVDYDSGASDKSAMNYVLAKRRLRYLSESFPKSSPYKIAGNGEKRSWLSISKNLSEHNLRSRHSNQEWGMPIFLTEESNILERV